MVALAHRSVVRARAEASGRALGLRVESARSHTLVVRFDDRHDVPADGTRFEQLTVIADENETSLGPCLFEVHRDDASTAKSPPAVSNGDGSLVFLERIFDFRQLLRTGRVIDLRQKVEQLPLVWNRKTDVKPSFRFLVSQLLFDLQVYRALFDELDRALEVEPYSARRHAQRLAIQGEYEGFRSFIDMHLAQLEDETRPYDKQESEQHGFYFRKQLWDILLSSEFLARTNLKPRGYAGDSSMMRMIYENEPRGRTVFSRFMHRHPLQTDAAQAVRNRCGMIAKEIGEVARRAGGDCRRRGRVLSLACGPAWELREAVHAAEQLDRLDLVLVDQDPLALEEAQATLTTISSAFRHRVQARIVRESARTMIRRADLTADWGQFSLVYSMGLFDYLTQPVAKAVIGKLWELLAPGGELVVGNFHPRNATRTYMEYWMDWVLYYRTEDELRELASDLDGADVDLFFESTGSQMFLRVRRR